MTSRSAVVVTLLVALAAGLGGCTPRAEHDLPAPPYRRAPFITNWPVDELQKPGHELFLTGTWGTEVLGSWPPAWFLVDLQQNEYEVFGEQFWQFGFLWDPNDDLPVGLKRGRDDPTQVKETCALCHVAELPDGRRWAGMPNTRLDIGRFRVEVNRRWVAAGYPSRLSPLDEEKLLALGPGRFDASSDDFPEPVPADFPPYLRLSEKTALNYLGTGGDLRSEIAMAVFTFGAGARRDDGRQLSFPSDEAITEFEAVMGGFEPPEAPYVDLTEAARGREVFQEAGCALCHFPADVASNGVIPYAADGVERLPDPDDEEERGAIATSYAHRLLVDGDDDSAEAADSGNEGSSLGVDVGRMELIAFIVSNGLDVGPTDGYRTPDLGGLWATAPYLHNGSVPTLEDLLKPAADRPETFDRGGGFVVDTTLFGNSNQGHEFGVDLPEADKTALLAFLRSL